MNREPTLSKALTALAPYFPRVVVVGGTAHRLFPLHPLGSFPSHELLTTEDVDLAVALELGSRGDTSLLDGLRAAGFEERIRGAQEPEYIYVLKSEPRAYLQFLAPLSGSGERRDGKPNVRLEVCGVQATKLRAIDLLLLDPWFVALSDLAGEQRVPVANPVAYLVQKLLKLHERPPEKRGKDLLYVFDTLTIFADRLEDLGASARDIVSAMTAKQRGQVAEAAAKHCFALSDAARRAAGIAGSQRIAPPTAAQLVEGCRYGLSSVLPDLFWTGPETG